MKRRNKAGWLGRLLRGQGGMESIQTVAITAVAAAVMIGVAKVGNEVKKWTGDRVKEMKQESDKGLKEQLQDFASDKAGEAYDKVEGGAKDLLDDVF